MFNALMENKWVREISQWLCALGIAVVVYLVLHSLVFKTMVVNGVSMEPTLAHGDRTIISLLSYRLGQPQLGDVVAFSYPLDPEQKYVKRIVALPGDTVDLVDYRFTVNGELLNDPFSEDVVNAFGDVSFPLVVPPDSYFVLGDNRNASKDSRYTSVGCVSKDIIVGKVVFRFWPADNLGGI